MTKKNQPFKMETRYWLHSTENEIIKKNWRYFDWGSGVWVQDLDKEGNPVPTGSIGIHWGNLIEKALMLTFFGLVAFSAYLHLTIPI
jgi:hypothetical protein